MPVEARQTGEREASWRAPKLEGAAARTREVKKPSIDEALSQAENLIQRRINRTGGSHGDIASNAGMNFVTALRGADALRDNKAIVAAEDRLLAFLRDNGIGNQDRALEQFGSDLAALGVDLKTARREVAQNEEVLEPTVMISKEAMKEAPKNNTRREADVVSIEAARARAAKVVTTNESRPVSREVERPGRVIGDDNWAERAKQSVVEPTTQNSQLTNSASGGNVFSRLWDRIRGR